MRRRLLALVALILTATMLAYPQSTCDKADKYCWDNSEYLVGLCMIVHEDVHRCANDGADFYESCMAERGCAPRDH